MKIYRLPCGVGDRVIVIHNGEEKYGIVHEVNLDKDFNEWIFTVYLVEDRVNKLGNIMRDVPYDFERFLERDFGETIKPWIGDSETLKWRRPIPTTIKSYTRICPYCGRNAYVIGTEYKFCPHCGKEVAV